MKNLLPIFLLLPCFVIAQTQTDYEVAIGRFMKFYNTKQCDSIVNMWPADAPYIGSIKRSWNKEVVESLHTKYGKLLSYEYVGIDTEDSNPGLAVFKTKYSVVGEKTTSLSLDDKNYLSTFRFITSSDGIDKLLRVKK
jgi:hypothetical protein